MTTLRSVPTKATPDQQRCWRCAGDDGSVIVEFALILPLIAALVFGLVDYGLALRQDNQLTLSVASAGRRASTLATNRFADFEALRALAADATSGDVTLEKVIIWKASSGTAPVPPASCLALTTGGVAGVCNVYNASQVAQPNPAVGFKAGSSSSPTCASGSWDTSWCPVGRNNSERSADFVGVYAEVRYTSFTYMIPSGGLDLSSGVVYRLEPPFVGG
jgi:hypothetical protein